MIRFLRVSDCLRPINILSGQQFNLPSGGSIELVSVIREIMAGLDNLMWPLKLARHNYNNNLRLSHPPTVGL